LIWFSLSALCSLLSLSLSRTTHTGYTGAWNKLGGSASRTRTPTHPGATRNPANNTVQSSATLTH